MNRIVFGVVGPMASGKGVVINILKANGFTVYSLSDILRQTAKQLRLPINRVVLQDIGDLLRKHGGNGVLLERIVDLVNKSHNKKVVIDSIRHPEEIKVLKTAFDIRLIGVNAGIRRCFKNILKRNRNGDPNTWKKFEPIALRDRGVGQRSNGQQVAKCLELAQPHVIKNDSTLEILKQKIRAELILIGIELQK